MKKNNIFALDSLEELTVSELKEIEGGAYNIWYALGYAISWITDVDYKSSETMMNCI
jgi:bacteriocin-like protein